MDQQGLQAQQRARACRPGWDQVNARAWDPGAPCASGRMDVAGDHRGGSRRPGPWSRLANWGVTDPGQLRWLDLPPPGHGSRRSACCASSARPSMRRHALPRPGVALARFQHTRAWHMCWCRRSAGKTRQWPPGGRAAVPSVTPLVARRCNSTSADITLRIDALAALRGHARLPSGFDATALRQIDAGGTAVPPAVSQRLPMKTGRFWMRRGAWRWRTRTGWRWLPPLTVARYLMRNGRAALLDATDPLRGGPFLAIAAVDAGMREGVVWLAATLDLAQFESLFGAQIIAGHRVR